MRNSVLSVPQYELSVRVLPDERQLEVRGTLRLPPASAPRARLELDLSGVMRDFSVEIREPAASAGPATLTVKEENRDRVTWSIYPAKPIPARVPVLLRFAYVGGESGGFVFALDPSGCFACGSNTAWYPYFAESNGRGTGVLGFSTPNAHSLLATGSPRRRRKHKGTVKHRFIVERPAQFSFASGTYTVARRDGEVPITAYFRRRRPGTWRLLDRCAEILSVLVEEFDPYPYGQFGLVEVPPALAARAGFSGASCAGFILSAGCALDAEFNLAYFAPEISHQWWGNLVTLKGEEGNCMLDEAMAQYGALRAVEILEGPAAAEQFRRAGYPGYIRQQSGLGYLELAASGRDQPLSRLPPGPLSHELADSKGFLVLFMLAQAAGHIRLRRALQAVARQHAFRSISWREFLAAVGRAARTSLDWFYDQWFDRTSAPKWSVAWSQEGKTVRGEISQVSPPYRADLEVELRGNDRRRALRVEVTREKQEFACAVDFPVDSIELDPHFYVLHWIP
jgi:hypothetical protein